MSTQSCLVMASRELTCLRLSERYIINHDVVPVRVRVCACVLYGLSINLDVSIRICLIQSVRATFVAFFFSFFIVTYNEVNWILLHTLSCDEEN